MKHRTVFHTRPLVRLAASFAVAQLIFGDCLPATTGSITINGIVAGRVMIASGGPAACKARPGSGAVPAAKFLPTNGVAPRPPPVARTPSAGGDTRGPLQGISASLQERVTEIAIHEDGEDLDRSLENPVNADHHPDGQRPGPDDVQDAIRLGKYEAAQRARWKGHRSSL